MNVLNWAVGISCRAMNFLEKTFEPSILAAKKLGPKTGMPTVEVIGLDKNVVVLDVGAYAPFRK